MKKITVLDIQRLKHEQKKIVMLTAYDYPFARILDECGVDIVLVGDSVGNVIMGLENTLPVTLEEMAHHARAVRRGCKQALVVADMPFLSYQVSGEEAKKNAGYLLKHTGAEAVKLEGGENIEGIIRALTLIDIPVMAHIGLTPQSIHRMGGYKVQGKQEAQRQKLLADAAAVERAGAFAVVLECIPAVLAKEITQSLTIPTIGIGAGPYCDGQVLVLHDLLGLSGRFRPKFVRQYAQLEDTIKQAVNAFSNDVRTGTFPSDEYSFK